MPIPTPSKGEDKNAFVSRCIRFLKREDPNMDNKQATAICFDKFREKSNQSADNWKKLDFVVPIQQSAGSGVGKSGDFLISGVAINSTLTRNGVEFLAEELELSATSLRNKPLLKDHTNSVDSIVGRTTENTGFDGSNSSVQFEARVIDEDMKEKIKKGLITSVSVGATVQDLEESEDGNHVVARGIDFLELSLVAVPADPNAGFAQALFESYNMKHQSELVEQQVNTQQESKMEEKTKVEEKAVQESANDKILETLASMTEQFSKVSEKVVSLSEKVSDLETKKIDSKVDNKEEAKEEKTIVEETVDETTGVVTQSEDTDDSGAVLVFENTGRMGSVYMSSYDSKFKKLNREVEN